MGKKDTPAPKKGKTKPKGPAAAKLTKQPKRGSKAVDIENDIQSDHGEDVEPEQKRTKKPRKTKRTMADEPEAIAIE